MVLRFMVLLAVAVTGSNVHTSADHEHGILCEGFLPENDLKIPVSLKYAGMSEADFNRAIDNVATVYAPIVSAKGGRLRVVKLWKNDEVNAMAYRQGRDYVVEIYGGLGRHPVMSADAVSLVTCHEIGHHIGGLPKYSDNNGRWASVEGQSDYFATLKCLRKVFKKYPASAINVEPAAKRDCNERYGVDTEDSRLCQRIAMASLSAAKMTATLDRGVSPRLDLRDSSVVTRTYERHPKAQCRLDTYYQGAQCEVKDSVDINDRDLYTGMCRNIASEDYGARPKCWFKPTGLSDPQPDPNPGPEPEPQPDPDPDPDPRPDEDIAPTPTINGKTTLNERNPNRVLQLRWDVSQIRGAVGIYFEILYNGEFQDPNGVTPDPRAIPGRNFRGTRGAISILPARQLPGWGEYKIRVIPLDATGRAPAGRFSNPAILQLRP